MPMLLILAGLRFCVGVLSLYTQHGRKVLLTPTTLLETNTENWIPVTFLELVGIGFLS